MMERIVISGGWSYGNLGDEAIALSTIGLIETAFPAVPKIYTSYDPKDFKEKLLLEAEESIHALIKDMEHPIENLSSCIAHPERYGLQKFCDLFVENTLFVMSGGGYFDGNWTSQFAARILEIELAVKCGAKVAIIGQSIGPFVDDTQVAWVSRALSKTSYLNVRDESSRQLLKKLLPEKEITCCCDVALTISDFLPLHPEKKEKICNLVVQIYTGYVENGVRKKKNDKLTKRLTLKLYRYNIAWVRLIRQLHKKRGCQCRIILNVQATSKISNNHFERFARQLKRFSGCHDMEIVNNTGLQAFCEELAKADAIVSCKMHPLIISSSYGVPAYAISQHYKIDAFMKWIGRERCCQKNSSFSPKKIVRQIMDEDGKPFSKDEVQKRKAEIYNMIEDMKKKCG